MQAIKIEKSWPQFLEALEKRSIIINESGKWRRRSSFFRKIFEIISNENDALARSFTQCLHKLEAVPVKFSHDPSLVPSQKKDFQKWLKASDIISESLKSCKSEKCRQSLVSLEIAAIKLRYRIEQVNGGIDPVDNIDIHLCKQLERSVLNWKKSDEDREVSCLTKREEKKIRKMCRYPEYVKILLKSPKNLHVFFQRALRYNIGIKELCEFENEIEEMNKVHLLGRVGKPHRKLLTVDFRATRQENIQKKTLNLLCRNKKINILKKKQYVFDNNTYWTVQKVYKDFYYKNERPGKLNVMWNGVDLWNEFEWGPEKRTNKKSKQKNRFISTDATQHAYFKKEDFPIQDILTAGQIEREFSIKLKEKECLGMVEASSQDTLDLNNSHGFITIFYYIEEGEYKGKYRAYSTGMFADPKEWPSTLWKQLRFPGKTIRGRLVYPDPNYGCYPMRKKASWLKPLSKETAENMLYDLGKVKEEGGIFMWAWENCAYFAQYFFEKYFGAKEQGGEIPEFFKKHFSKCLPRGILGVVHKIYISLPKIFWPFYESLIHALLGSRRTFTTKQYGQDVTKCTYDTPFGSNADIKLPAAMHERIKRKKISGVLSYGHR